MSIRKHTLYNLLGALLPLGLSLGTVPIYVRLIGESRYGVLAMVWLLVGYFGLFDLGLSQATAQRIAALSNSSGAERARTLGTALAVNGALGVVGALVIWPVAAYFFGRGVVIEQPIQTEIDAVIPWIVLAVPLATLSGVLTGALQGCAQFLQLNAISLWGAVLTQVLPLVVVWLYGPNLAWVVPTVIVARLISMALLFACCRAHLLRGHAWSPSWPLAKTLLGYGGWVTVSAVASPIMVILDRFVIGGALGAKSVTYYTVPFQLGSRMGIVSNSLSSALFPRLAAADRAEDTRLSDAATRFLAATTTLAVVIGLFLMHPFLNIWMGHPFAAKAALTGQVLLLGFWANGLAVVPYAQLQANMRPRTVAQCHLLELLPYVCGLYIGLRLFGLPGAAVAFTLRTVVDYLLLLYFAGSLRTNVVLLMAPTSIVLLSFAVVLFLPAEGASRWLAAAILIPGVAWWGWACIPVDVRRPMMEKARCWAFSLSKPIRRTP